MADLNRTNIALPTDVSSEIIAKTLEDSAFMAKARNISLPGRGLTIPVITGEPEAAWVGETEKKPVSNHTLGTKVMQEYKIAVIETVSVATVVPRVWRVERARRPSRPRPRYERRLPKRENRRRTDCGQCREASPRDIRRYHR